MKLLTSPKAQYLLFAGVEVLHEQSIEWLNEIAFWRDETAFLYSLLVNKTLRFVPITAKNNIERVEAELITLTGGELDDLQQAVELHEKVLNNVVSGKHTADEQSYREQHYQLTLTFNKFETRFKFLKKEIFDLAKQAANIEQNK